MDVTKMLAELKQEREAIEEAVMILERLAPAWMTSLTKATATKKPGRPRKAQKDASAGA